MVQVIDSSLLFQRIRRFAFPLLQIPLLISLDPDPDRFPDTRLKNLTHERVPLNLTVHEPFYTTQSALNLNLHRIFQCRLK
jgi:hypothetical protein